MLTKIPQAQIRIHICWGNYEGPHDYDIALEKIMPAVKKIRMGAIVFEAANPRHEHEWTVWRDTKLPDNFDSRSWRARHVLELCRAPGARRSANRALLLNRRS